MNNNQAAPASTSHLNINVHLSLTSRHGKSSLSVEGGSQHSRRQRAPPGPGWEFTDVVIQTPSHFRGVRSPHAPALSLSLSHIQTSSVAVVSRSAQYLPGLQLEMSKLATVLLYISVRWTRLAVFNFQVSGVTGQQRRVSAGPRTHCSPLSSS